MKLRLQKITLIFTLGYLLPGFAISPIFASSEGINLSQITNEMRSKIRFHKLPNGVRIILMKNGVSPTIACYLKVGVGSSNEPFDISGAAHFLEHLLFKGTDTLGTMNYPEEKKYLSQIEGEGERHDEIHRKLGDPLLTEAERTKLQQQKILSEKRISALQKASQKFIISEEDSKAYSLAGQVGYNAYTTADVTNYQIKLPKNRLEMWAEMESTRFLNPVFREFYAERKVILEERRMRYDSQPNAKLYELFLTTAFGFSPYGKPVIGTESNILKLKQSEIRKFYDENYTPSRMVIAIVGDIDFETSYKILSDKFSRLKPRKPTGFPPIELPEQLGKKTAVLEADHNPLMISGYLRPSVYEGSDIIFDILSKALGSGQTSRLYKKLVIEKKLASSVGIYASLPGDRLTHAFAIIVQPFEEASYSEIEKLIEQEIKNLIAGGLSQDEIRKIKNRYLRDLSASLSYNAGLADNLTYYELVLNNYNAFFTGMEQLEKITNEDIKKVASRTFLPRRQTVVQIKRVTQN